MKKIQQFIDRHDKLVHWLTCILIGLLSLIISAWVHEPNIYLAVANILIAGFGKELYDKYVKKTFFDWLDIVADMLAIPVVVIVYYIFW